MGCNVAFLEDNKPLVISGLVTKIYRKFGIPVSQEEMHPGHPDICVMKFSWFST